MQKAIYLLAIILYLLNINNFLIAQQEPYGLSERIPNTEFLISSEGDTLADMELHRVFADLTFSRPVFLTHAHDGSDRIFVVEKRGIIKVFPNSVNVTIANIFLDIMPEVNSDPGEAGLLSMAFHPSFPDMNKFYVYYTYDSLYSKISEFQVSANPDSADVTTERILLEIKQPYLNHNGGQIAFGPDGYLYIGLGDGGSGGDPKNNGQNPTTLLGAILRIDVDNKTDTLEYGIPVDNPYVGNQNSWREEIWAWGLRNPWRFSFDRLTGELWTGDVGQNKWEEVDLIEKGKNYGWRIMEGFHCYNPASDCNTNNLTLPIVEYSHDVGRSITGGYVYRADRLERLKGVYLYGDYGTRIIWGLKYSNGQIEENKIIAESPSAISSFAEDESGEVYVVGYDGRIYDFQEKEGMTSPYRIPQTISESGVFQNIDSLILSPGLIPYSVNSQFWSDGAHKTRIIALPGTSQITFSKNGFWNFPANATIVKNFFLDLEKGNSESRKIVETRFLVKQENSEQWDGFSYMWNDSSSDAILLDSSYVKSFLIKNGDSSFVYQYYFPSRQQCKVCHTPSAGFVLGLNTAQMNKQHLYGHDDESIWDNQLRSYNHIGLFTEEIGEDYSDFPKLADPLDEKGYIEDRARSYLATNCSNCHRPEGTGRSNMDLRYSVTLDEMNIINSDPELGDLGIEHAKRIKPGAADSSVLYLRMIDLGEFRMPPLASSLVDQEGADLIAQWIDTLAVILQIEQHAVLPLPAQYKLYPAYPNPFNPTTTIHYDLPKAGLVEIIVFDIQGRQIESVINEIQPAGSYNIQWDASRYASGLYFYRFKANEFIQIDKILLIK